MAHCTMILVYFRYKDWKIIFGIRTRKKYENASLKSISAHCEKIAKDKRYECDEKKAGYVINLRRVSYKAL